MNTLQRPTLLAALFGAVLSMSVNASDNAQQLLAGVEAGIDSDTAMTITDLNKTQSILFSEPKGSANSWYNLDTTTHYEVIVGEEYSINQRPCISYKITVKHSSSTEKQDLNACLNYDSQWISKTEKLSMK